MKKIKEDLDIKIGENSSAVPDLGEIRIVPQNILNLKRIKGIIDKSNFGKTFQVLACQKSTDDGEITDITEITIGNATILNKILFIGIDKLNYQKLKRWGDIKNSRIRQQYVYVPIDNFNVFKWNSFIKKNIKYSKWANWIDPTGGEHSYWDDDPAAMYEQKNLKKINQLIKEETYRVKCWKIINEGGKFPSEKIEKLLKEYKNNNEEIEKYYKLMEPTLKKIEDIEIKQNEISDKIQSSMKSYNKKEIMISGYVAKLLKLISTSEGRIKYKESFEKALEYVNAETKKLLNEFASGTKQTKKTVDYIFSIEKTDLNEGILDDIKVKIKNLFFSIKKILNSILNKFANVNKAQDDFIATVKDVFENYQPPFNTLKK